MTDTTDVFAHDREAALCRWLLGERAHGLDTLVERTRPRHDSNVQPSD